VDLDTLLAKLAPAIEETKPVSLWHSADAVLRLTVELNEFMELAKALDLGEPVEDEHEARLSLLRAGFAWCSNVAVLSTATLQDLIEQTGVDFSDLVREDGGTSLGATVQKMQSMAKKREADGDDSA